MVSAPQLESPPDPRSQAGPARRAFHLLIAGAGWVLFGWWWVIVLRRTSGSEIGFTVTFLCLSLAVIVIVTSLWVAHNLALFRRKSARKRVRERMVDQSSDTLGRSVAVVGGPATLQDSAMVRIVVEGGRKVYRSADASWDRSSRPAGGSVGDPS